jgi:hypothetical protein
MRVRSSRNRSFVHCLCPPSSYGHRCQYQNQRVSLTVHIQLIADWRQAFLFHIALLDD